MFEKISSKEYIYVGRGGRSKHMVKANGSHAAHITIGSSSSIAIPKELLGKRVIIKLVVVKDGK